MSSHHQRKKMLGRPNKKCNLEVGEKKNDSNMVTRRGEAKNVVDVTNMVTKKLHARMPLQPKLLNSHNRPKPFKVPKLPNPHNPSKHHKQATLEKLPQRRPQ